MTDAACYTNEGAGSAGSSNLALGVRSAADSVDLYVDDGAIRSLGHRRWVLNPYMGETSFGLKPPASCMFSFSMSGSGRGSMVAWPPPGYAPVMGANGAWSFASSTHRVTMESTVEVAIDDQPFATIEARFLGAGFGSETVLAWDSTWTAGHTVRVRIHGTSAGDFAYTVRTIRCP